MEDAVVAEFKSTEQRQKSQFSELANKFDEIKKEIEGSSKGWVTKKDLKESIAKLSEKLDEKVSLKEVQSAITDMQTEVAAKFLKIQDSIKNSDQKLNEKMKRKANLEDLHDSLSTKLDQSSVMQSLEQKASQTDIESLRKHFRQLETQVSSNIKHQADAVKAQFEEIGKSMLLKANVKDVLTLIDERPSRQDFESSLKHFI